MYVKVTNGSVDTYPYSVGQLRRDNPQTSFPKQIPSEMLAEYGVHPVVMPDAPSIDVRTQKNEQATTPTLEDGIWTLTWSTTSKTAEQIAEYDANTAAFNRETRNKLLDGSDWTQMNDSPLSNEAKTSWSTYRQELRGITDLDAWPNLADEDWPVAP
jgi:hypothetical protein